MVRPCDDCNAVYDDVSQWTICPHGPLWARSSDYCREHDLVKCKFHTDPKEDA